MEYNLQPYYKFEYKGHIYLLNIEKMESGEITKETSLALDELFLNPEEPLTDEVIKELDRFWLLKKTRTIEGPDIDTGFVSGDPEGKNSYSQQSEGELPVCSINLFVTQECNLKCIYCYGGGGEYGNKSFMDKKTAFRAVDWLIEQSGDMKELSVSFFGGEPLLNFRLINNLVPYIKEKEKKTDKKIKMCVTTNGSLLDVEKIKFFKENNVEILVSFDGPREIQDYNRPFKDKKDSTYEVTVPKIKELLNIKPDTHCRATHYGNVDPDIIIEGLKEIGFKCIQMSDASYSMFDEEKNMTLELISSRKDKLLKNLEVKTEELITAIKNRNIKTVKELKFLTAIQSLLSPQKYRRFFSCGAGRFYVGISTCGNVYPCHRFVGVEKYNLGNIYDNNLKRDYLLKSRIKNVQKCMDCWCKYYCGGGCIHEHAGLTGSIFEPNEFSCKQIKFTTMMKIYLTASLDKNDLEWIYDNEITIRPPCYFDL